MKKWLIFFIIALCPRIWAQSYHLHLNFKNGTAASYSVSDIQQITFSGVTNIGPEDTEKIKQIVETFLLFQNYPNPFNATTTFEYEISKPGRVEIKIFNISGRLVKRIMNEFQEAGVHKTIWDGKNEYGQSVTSGLYVYHVEFENSILLKKMMLVK